MAAKRTPATAYKMPMTGMTPSRWDVVAYYVSCKKFSINPDRDRIRLLKIGGQPAFRVLLQYVSILAFYTFFFFAAATWTLMTPTGSPEHRRC